MTTEERIQKLERNNRRLGIGITILVLFGGTIVATSATSVPPQDLVVRSLSVVDENGKTRASLMADVYGAGLQLLDEDGNVRAELVSKKTGTALTLRDGSENGNVRLAIGKNGPNLILQDSNGNKVSSLP